MSAYTLTINGKAYTVDAPDNMPLLWVLRETLGLTGTKFGCGKGFCGSCTVHLGGEAIRSCITPMSAIQGKTITTIEGLSVDRSHPLQQAWIQHQVSQCGYCQSGQIMAAAAMLKRHAQIDVATIEREMDGVLCRCGSYQRIKQAILSAAQQVHDNKSA